VSTKISKSQPHASMRYHDVTLRSGKT